MPARAREVAGGAVSRQPAPYLSASARSFSITSLETQ